MPDQYRKLIPAPVRRTLGRAYSWGVKTRTDFQTVEATCRSLAPKVLKARVRLGGKRPTVAAVFAGRNDDFVPDNEERIRAVIEWNTKVLCDEVIFVEWNPLPQPPIFSTTLVKDYPTLKAFVIPPQVHTEVSENSK